MRVSLFVNIIGCMYVNVYRWKQIYVFGIVNRELVLGEKRARQLGDTCPPFSWNCSRAQSLCDNHGVAINRLLGIMEIPGV